MLIFIFIFTLHIIFSIKLKNIFSLLQKSDVEHIYSDAEHIYSDVEHIYSDAEHIYSDAEHIYSDVEHIYSGVEHIYSDAEHIYSDVEHIYSGVEHIYTNLGKKIRKLPEKRMPEVLKLYALSNFRHCTLNVK